MLGTEQLNLTVERLATMPGTMNLKRAVLEGSVFQSLALHFKFATTSTVASRSKLSMFSLLTWFNARNFFKSS